MSKVATQHDHFGQDAGCPKCIRAHLDDCVILSFAMPGDLALKSTAVETFFYGMKPRYPAGRGYDLYQNQTLVGTLGVLFIPFIPFP